MSDPFIKPIQLGNLLLPINIVQAPLAGYSCAPLRVLATRYGKPGFCSTEMISSNDLVHRKNHPKRYLYKDSEEGILSYQLSGNHAETLGKAAAIVSKAGADIIDLNCGCPVDKIRKKQSGSKLLTTPEKIYDLVSAMKQNTDATISVKMRVATPHYDHNEQAVIDAATQAGADFLTVHGRHWTQKYDVDCQLDAIARIVSMSKIPVFANGDIADAQSLKTTFEKTNCAGVMIGRACVGRPWLYQKIVSEYLNETFHLPNITEIADIFIEHIQRLMLLESEKLAILQARKLAKYYSEGVRLRSDFILAAQQVTQFQEIEDLIKQYFIL